MPADQNNPGNGMPGLGSGLSELLSKERQRQEAAEELARLRRIEAEYNAMRNTNPAPSQSAHKEDEAPAWFVAWKQTQDEIAARSEERYQALLQDNRKRQVLEHVAQAEGLDLVRHLGAEEYVLGILQDAENRRQPMGVAEAAKMAEESLRAQAAKVVSDERIRNMLLPQATDGGKPPADGDGAAPPPKPPAGGTLSGNTGERNPPPDQPDRPLTYQDRVANAIRIMGDGTSPGAGDAAGGDQT